MKYVVVLLVVVVAAAAAAVVVRHTSRNQILVMPYLKVAVVVAARPVVIPSHGSTRILEVASLYYQVEIGRAHV